MRRHRLLNLLGVLVVASVIMGCGLLDGATGEEQEAPPEQHPPGELGATPTREYAGPATDKWDLWRGGTRLRGADLHPCWLASDGVCAEFTSRQDVQDLRDLGANVINASYPGVFTEQPPYQVDSTTLAYLDELIGWAEEVDIYVVIHFRTGPGRNEAAIHAQDDALYAVWTDQAAHEAWIEMWRFTAERYRNSSVVVGYNLMVEPHVNTLIDPDGELDPLEVQAQIEGTLMDWNVFAAELTTAIREVDPDTPIIVNSLNWADSWWFPALEPTGDSRTVYSLHAYNPDVYTNQEAGEISISYPDVVEDYGETITFDRSWLEEDLRPALEFAQQYDVPIYVGEFGTTRWVPGAVEFNRDLTALFERYGWNYVYYTWRADDAEWDGFNLEYGLDPSNHAPLPDNPLLGIHVERWAQNVDFPGESAPASAEPVTTTAPPPSSTAESVSFPGGLPSLADVSHWLYLIDVNLEPDTVEQIVASEYDMVVVDFIPSEENNTNYPMAEVVERLHNASHPKLVIAYIDIGEAEDYRTYWQEGWGVGNPEWIAGEDPDGWEGNYPVAFWYDEWQEIWLGEDGILPQILDAGFDGVYLDWIEAYSDENVIAIAEQDDVDPEEEMMWWVWDISDFVKGRCSECVVIAQNAAGLAEYDDYRDAIDAISQEQVWFDGGADNDPPGDCPLPRTDAEVDTDAYRASLSEPCRRYFDSDPNSPLHVSSEEYLYYLTLAQHEGILIFTVDYALNPENVAWVYETSRSLGFVPFVSNRALDLYIEPVP